MHPERVVVINDFGSVNGGAAQVAIASAAGLARAGLRVDYFCGVGPRDARLEAAGVAVHCLDQLDILHDPKRLRAATRGVWNTRAERELTALLASCDPRSTVAHLHGWTKSLSSSVFHAVNRLRFPLVVTMHDYFAVCPNGGFFDYQSSQICTRRPLGLGCVARNCDARSYPQKLWRVARQAVSETITQLPHDVIYLSQFSRAILAPYFAPDTCWHEVRNPVLVSRADRVQAEHNAAFLFLGRVAPEKGVLLFAAAARCAGVQARVAGDGPLRAELERAWPEVASLGWLSADAARAELRSARALVFPSLWYEVQPLVLKEALANGIPVIAAEGTAARDAIDPGINGLLFRHGSIESLAHALQRLGDDHVVAAMSARAYHDYWDAPQTLDAHCAELKNVYVRVLARA